MSKKFTILVDMDDTIVNTVRTWIEFLNDKYGLSVKYEDLVVWEMQAAYPSLTVKQLDSVLYTPEFWSHVEPKLDAVEYLEKLINDGHDVYICSASHPATIYYKVYNCLLMHFPFLDTKQMIFTTNKKLLNADFLIDDGIHNIIGANYTGLLIDAPYNKHINTDKFDNVIRVSDFRSAYEFIRERANGSS